MTTPEHVYPLVDARCNHPSHERKGNTNVYRTIGHCTNCGNGPLLVLVTSGHPMPTSQRCPKCGCYDVRSDRLAEDDELPEVPA